MTARTATPNESGPVWNSEVSWMENGGNEARGRTAGDGREQFPGRLGVASEDPRSRTAPSWANWQSALYLFVLGWICVFLVPLTSFWWIVPVLGTAVPITLAMLERPGLLRPDDRKNKERELLGTLAELGVLTPTGAAMRTSLTVDEASKILEELARNGHLGLHVEDGIIAYALRERDRREPPSDASAPLEAESYGAQCRPGAPKQLDDPLSGRELEVLNLLASGRTNSEVARELFVSVGTVKSHTNNIYRKLGARNRAGALARARGLDLL